jgi:hypothetical protein
MSSRSSSFLPCRMKPAGLNGRSPTVVRITRSHDAFTVGSATLGRPAGDSADRVTQPDTPSPIAAIPPALSNVRLSISVASVRCSCAMIVAFRCQLEAPSDRTTRLPCPVRSRGSSDPPVLRTARPYRPAGGHKDPRLRDGCHGVERLGSPRSGRGGVSGLRLSANTGTDTKSW